MYLLAGLLELVVLVLELVLEVGDDLVVVRAREVLVPAAVANLEELLAGVDDGLLQRLHLLLELDVVRSRGGELAGEPRHLFVEGVDVRDVVFAEATDGIGVGGPEAMIMRGGRCRAASRRAMDRVGPRPRAPRRARRGRGIFWSAGCDGSEAMKPAATTSAPIAVAPA